jgi:hypothetical protein
MTLAFDSKAFAGALKAGQGPLLMDAVLQELGLSNDYGYKDWLPRNEAGALALDAQSELVTVSNAGIPALLSTYIDPKLIEVLVAPMKAAEAVGLERRFGTWTDNVVMFTVVESEGEVATYGDYSTNGSVDANLNFPQRQSYLYQTFTQYGERQLANAGLAKVDWAARLQIASALILNKYQNYTYLYGVTNLQNYGLTNDPSLPAAIAPTFSWLTNASATALTVYQDIVRLFIQLVGQANGTVDEDTRMVLALSPQNKAALNYISTYNVNVYKSLADNYPNMRIVSIPEFSTTAGQLVMLWAEEVEGQRTMEVAFTEKMRVHNTVIDVSSWKQKKSQSSLGCIIYRPMLIAQMLG